MRGPSRQIYFATSNRGKFGEAEALLAQFGIALKQLNTRKSEIQSDSLEEIAVESARGVASACSRAAIVEDAGLFIDALRGFPGPYSSYVFRKLGVAGILTLMRGRVERKAKFRSVVGFCAPGRRPRSFTGEVEGFIAQRAGGSGGFGFDPIFVPVPGDGRTFAEMPVREKNLISHRSRALRRFAVWYTNRARTRREASHHLNRP